MAASPPNICPLASSQGIPKRRAMERGEFSYIVFQPLNGEHLQQTRNEILVLNIVLQYLEVAVLYVTRSHQLFSLPLPFHIHAPNPQSRYQASELDMMSWYPFSRSWDTQGSFLSLQT